MESEVVTTSGARSLMSSSDCAERVREGSVGSGGQIVWVARQESEGGALCMSYTQVECGPRALTLVAKKHGPLRSGRVFCWQLILEFLHVEEWVPLLGLCGSPELTAALLPDDYRGESSVWIRAFGRAGWRRRRDGAALTLKEELLRRVAAKRKIFGAWSDLKNFLPGLGWELSPGAPEDQIQAFEDHIGHDLPPELRASFALHDGCDRPGVVVIASIDGMQHGRNTMMGLLHYWNHCQGVGPRELAERLYQGLDLLPLNRSVHIDLDTGALFELQRLGQGGGAPRRIFADLASFLRVR